MNWLYDEQDTTVHYRPVLAFLLLDFHMVDKFVFLQTDTKKWDYINVGVFTFHCRPMQNMHS